MLADTGYFSEANVALCAAAQIDPMIAQGRQSLSALVGALCQSTVGAGEPDATRSHEPPSADARRQDALRKQIPEPVFGIIKSVMGFRQFLLRGLENVQGEWTLVTMAWNMKRMFALAIASGAWPFRLARK